MMHREYNNTELLPTAWARERDPQDYYITNPSILPWQGEWLLAYKVVTARYHSERFAICRLDTALTPQPGSAVPLSESIPNALPQVGDPRLFLFRGRPWAIYCHFRLPSLLYLVELDPESLQAVGPARPLLLDERQWQEKNWMPFENDGDLLAVYSIAPQVILRLDLSARDVIRCERRHQTAWDVSAYARRYGEPRGGSPPVRVGDFYHVFFHSRWFTHPLHTRLAPAWHHLRQRIGYPEHWQGRRLADGDVRPLQAVERPPRAPLALRRLIHLYERLFARRWYAAGGYSFEARPPFKPIAISGHPLLKPEKEPAPLRRQRLSPLNERVVFPCGAAPLTESRWLVSYGLHDERCVIREVQYAPR
jgi:hypothetical protein